MYGYIYKTTNLVNGKIYIGQHKAKVFEPNNYLGSGVIFNKALEKYGIENFKQELLEECTSKEELNNREIYWISFYNSTDADIGYNMTFGGDGGDTFSCVSKEEQNIRRQKISKANKNPSAETRLKMSRAQKGRTISIETRLKMSKSRKGRKLTQEWKDKIGNSIRGEKNPNYGRVWDNDFRKKQREAQSNPIYCVELDLHFTSIRDAARYLHQHIYLNNSFTSLRNGISYSLKHNSSYKNQYSFRFDNTKKL